MEIQFSDEQINIAKKKKKALMVLGLTDKGGEHLTLISGPCNPKSREIIRRAIIEVAQAEE